MFKRELIEVPCILYNWVTEVFSKVIIQYVSLVLVVERANKESYTIKEQ